MNFTIKPTTYIKDNKNNELVLSDITNNDNIECITQLKYILFSKDTCFTIWELCSIKIIKIAKRVHRVPQFGFIEYPEDEIFQDSEDNNLQEDYSFF